MSTRLLPVLIFALLAISSFAGKRGLAWPWNGQAGDFGLFSNSGKIGWVYNWESWRPQGMPGRFEYVAMQRTAQGIEGLKNNMASNQAKVLLGFNEPDIGSQAKMSPDTAVNLWRQYINPIAQQFNLRVGSPAVSNGANGINWLQQFIQKCSGCRVDFVACHWYGPSFEHFRNHIENVHRAFPNKRVWVTEFALQGNPSASAQEGFMRQATAYLESSSFVERYSWFGAFRGGAGNNLIGGNGGLTNLGRTYN